MNAKSVRKGKAMKYWMIKADHVASAHGVYPTRKLAAEKLRSLPKQPKYLKPYRVVRVDIIECGSVR